MRTIAALGAAAVLLAACGSQQPSQRVADAPTSTGVTPPGCRGADLSASVQKSGGTMSQPFVTVALRNGAGQACWVKGYPAVRASVHAPGRPSHPLRIDLQHGSVYEHRDPGPHRVVVPAHGAASFTVGTGTAYGGAHGQVVITSLRIVVPGTGKAVSLSVSLNASHQAHQPVPVRITALQMNDG